MTQQSAAADQAGTWSRAARRPASIAGIGYTVAWVVSFVVGAPMPSVAASGDQIVAAYAGHDWPSIVNFVLSEGIAAVALAAVVLPRWLAPLAFLLAVTLVISGLGYVLLAAGLSDTVFASGFLLLVVVTATGVTLRTSR